MIAAQGREAAGARKLFAARARNRKSELLSAALLSASLFASPGQCLPDPVTPPAPAAVPGASGLSDAKLVHLGAAAVDAVPGDTVAFPPEAQANPVAPLVLLQDPVGTIWELRIAQRRPLSFEAPQLPGNLYRISLTGDRQPAVTFLLHLTPRLTATSPIAKVRETISVDVRVVGPTASPPPIARDGVVPYPLPAPPAPEPLRIAVTLRGVEEGRPSVMAEVDSTKPVAIPVKVRFVGPEKLRAESMGFVPADLTVTGIPVSPVPVVFVPGTGCSELSLPSGKRYWIDPSILLPRLMGGSINLGALNADGTDAGRPHLSATGSLKEFTVHIPGPIVALLHQLGGGLQPELVYPVYANTLAWARDTFTRPFSTRGWFEAPYDWRRAGADADNFRRLDAVVEEARRISGYRKVILLGHSLGGLMCRDYASRMGRDKVDSIIAVGTPWLGSPKTVRALLWGYNFGVGEMYPSSRYVYVTAPGKQMRRVHAPLRISFLDLSAAKRLAVNWPCVYEQLPAPAFMELYGQAHSEKSRSVIYGESPDRVLQLCASSNHVLMSEADAWRSRLFGHGDDFGVPHYLIAATASGEVGSENCTDMQIAEPERVNTGRDVTDALNSAVLDARRGLGPWLDPYVAVESGSEWGDGTTPLLSSTAGAQLRKDGPIDLRRALQLLGPSTRLKIVALSEGFGHGSMMDDPVVQRELLQICMDRSARLGFAFTPGASHVVQRITIEVSTRGDAAGGVLGLLRNRGTVDLVTGRLLGFEMPLNGGRSRLALTGGSVRRFTFRHPQIWDPLERAYRRMRSTDWPGVSVRFQKDGFDDWHCLRVRIFMEDTLVLDDRRPFSLDRLHPFHETLRLTEQPGSGSRANE